ncbi:MAG: PAS domain S-box protein [Candidatus Methanoperedens sp.]
MPDVRILIVEDEGIEALSLQHSLISMGYTVTDIVSTGEEAVIKAEEMRPDLVLMDIMLQGEIDGVTAAEQIHVRFNIPVIFITAYADEDTLQRAKMTEPYGYLVKPFQERELHISVDMAIYKHKMERKLKESEEWLATTLRSIGEAVITADKDGLITFMNPAAEGLTGWKPKEVINKKLTDVFKIINRDTRLPIENPVTRVLSEGITARLASHTILIRNGTEILIDDSAAPIKDDKGDNIGVVLVFRDITEHNRAEEKLMESEETFRTLVSASPDAVTTADLEGKVTFASEQTARLFGFASPEEVIGKSVFEFIAPEDQERALENLKKTLSEGFVKNLEYSFLRKDGSRFIGELNAALIKDAKGRPKFFIATTRDITKRKQADEKLKQTMAELERSNKDLEQFAYAASHDLQEPLRTVSNFSQLLAKRYKGELDTKADQFIGFIVDGTTRMQQMIDDLLAYSRVSTRAKPFEPTDCETVFDQALANVKMAIEESDALVTHDPLPTVMADTSQMVQLFQNLLSNAIKFRKEKPRITVSAAQGGNEWLFSVQDNGIGIAPEFMEHIFKMFQREHASAEYSGTGVGLAICKKIVERHGGRIWVESEQGKGSTFYFTIPVRKAERERT